MDKYNQNVGLFKALSDLNRMIIVDMLSCGEMCACRILEKLGITQPTLSHHMKILCDCGLVRSRKDGKWMYYGLNKETADAIIYFLQTITNTGDNCICETEGDLADELCEC